ncbi:MAG: prepilin-type N-terminal cleavage/methylation domain-containing protein [Patescibacteria group bacterium]|nr:prepilin-type N-terminal cleavage/methylation domain-containing protein [Patescibacteria group bacterium]
MRNFKARGFTLIELLVVIAIIAILASIILASLNTARSKSRDARRVSDLQQVALALELYNNDNNGYPSVSAASNISALSSALVPNYISAMPSDPTNSGTYVYLYASLSSSSVTPSLCTSGVCPSYVLQTDLENNNANVLAGSASTTVTGITCTGNYYYCVRP